MLKNVMKRCMSLALALLLICSILPEISLEAWAASGEIVPGLNANGDYADITGGIKVEATSTAFKKASGCGSGTNAAPKSATVTLTNVLSNEAKLSFDYTVSIAKKDDGYVKINDEAKTAGGHFEQMIDHNAKVKIDVFSGNPASNYTGTYTSKIEITNLSLAENKMVTTGFLSDGVGGSYTVDGQEVLPLPEGVKIEKNAQEVTVLVATPANGYKFFGWYSVTSETYLSKDATWETNLTTDQIIKAVFAPLTAPTFQVGAGNEFFDLNDAVAFAQSSGEKTIVLVGDGILPAGGYTIPSGKTLLIPYNNAHTVCITEPIWHANDSSGSSAKAYKTLTMASGANITVASGGTVSVSARAQNTTPNAGPVLGPWGMIQMQDGSNITVESGASLSCFGFISGQGSVLAKNGSKVYEDFQVTTFRGGNASASMNNGTKNKVFPFTQYYVQNIEVPMTMEAGATETVCIGVTMSVVGLQKGSGILVGKDSGLFRLQSGSITKRYDGSADRLIVEVNGDAQISSMTVKMGSAGNIDSTKFVVPITNNMTVQLNSGHSLEMAYDLAALPGAKITVAEGSSLSIAESFYFYDRDEWIGKGYAANGTFNLQSLKNAPGKKYNRTDADLTDALLDINGTVTINGALYTTAGGADITSSKGTGKVIFNASAGTEKNTYQVTQSGNTVAAQEVPITPAQLKNESAEANEYSVTAGAVAGDTFYYHDGMWDKQNAPEGELYPHIEAAEKIPGKAPTCTEPGLTEGSCCAVCGKELVAQTEIPANGHEYELKGENVVWSHEDGVDKVTATFTCKNCEEGTEGHSVPQSTEIVSANVDYKNCTDQGEKTYTATVVAPDGVTKHIVTDTVKVDRRGHDFEGQPWLSNENGHWQECKYDNCTATSTPVVHTASEEKKQENVKDSTCYKEGSYDEVVYCSVCGYEMSRVQKTIAKKDHNVDTSKWLSGETSHWHACANCSERQDEAEHTWNGGEVTKQPTCAAKGEKKYTCTVCGKTKTEEIEENPSNHVGETEIRNAKAAKCYEEGYTGDTYCKSCGALLKKGEAIPATAHNWDTVWSTDGDNHWHKCLNEGCTAKNDTAGHTPAEEAVRENVVDSTCYKEGSYDEVVYCSVCGYEMSRVPKTIVKKAHTPAAAVEENKIDSTCAKEGSYDSVVYCSVEECHAELSREKKTIAKKNHDFDTATWLSDGTNHWHKCKNCDAIDAKQEHTWNGGEVTKQPTCVAKGEKKYTCTACGQTKIEEIDIDSSNHVGETEIRNAKAAKCYEEGYTGDTYCKSCGALLKKGEAIPTTAHNWDTVWSTDGATHWHKCLNEGCHAVDEATKEEHQWVAKRDETNHWNECEICGYKKDVTAHQWATQWSEDENNHWHKCTGCEATSDMAEHTEEVRNAESAKCYEKGYTGDTYCKVCDRLLKRGTEIDMISHTYGEPEWTWTEKDGGGYTATATFTCTVDGCTDRAEGHSVTVTAEPENVTDEVTTAPKCTVDGERTYTAKVTFNGKEYTGTKSEPVTMLGHRYTEAPSSWSWSDDHNTATATFTCTREGCTASEEGHTKSVAAQVTTNKITADATCTGEGNHRYVATVTEGGKPYSNEQNVPIPAKGHDYGEPTWSWTSNSDGTCSATAIFTCQVTGCGEEGHILTQTVAGTRVGETDATCTTPGTITYKASVTITDRNGERTFDCGVLHTVVGAYAPHQLTKTERKEPTCTAVGTEEYWTCSVCGRMFSDAEGKHQIEAPQEIPMAEHTWEESKVTEATCAKEGKIEYICTVCKTATKTETIPVDPNKHVGETETRNKKEATCFETGYTGDTYCKDCGAKLKAGTVVSKKEHTYPQKGTVIRPATCNQEGLQTFTCTVEGCGHTETRPIAIDLDNHTGGTEIRNAREATCKDEGYTGDTYCLGCNAKIAEGQTIGKILDHKWSQWRVTKEANCTETGSKERSCSVCSAEEEEEIPALGHNTEGKVEHKDATCTEDGVVGGTYCTRCEDGKAAAEAVIDKLGHNTDGQVEHTDATCTDAGVVGGTYCTRCEDGKAAAEATIEALGHKWDEGRVTTAPTCTTEGVRTYTCEHDHSHTKTEPVAVDKDAHKWDEGKVTTEPTCTTEGVKTYTCEHDRSHTKTEPVAVDKDAHKWDEGEVTTEPTCTTEGVKTYTCTNDPTHTYTEKIAAKGHDIVHHEAKAATCTEIGWEAYDICSRCDYTTYQEIPAKGHTEVIDPAENPTCTEAGKTEGKHCSVCNVVLVEQRDILAKGHSYGEPEWTWTETEEGYEAVATFSCTECAEGTEGHIQIRKATVTSETTDATCTKDSVTIYTATVEFEDQIYITHKDITVVDSATGHVYEQPEWTWAKVKVSADPENPEEPVIVEDPKVSDLAEDEKWVVTATFTCTHCHEDVQTIVAEVERTEVPAECEKEGSVTDTATVTFNEQEYWEALTEVLNALGHDYTVERSDAEGHWHECSRCHTATEKEPHTFGSWVNNRRECSECGYEETRTPVAPAPGPSGDTEINPDPTPLGAPLPFEDVTEADADKGIKGDWFAPAVRYVYTHDKLMSGVTETMFSPNTFTTRGQLVTILWRLEGKPEVALSDFTDVAAGKYYTMAVAWANANGIVTGYSDTIFRPERNVSRQEAAAILYRYAKWKDYDVSTTANLGKYTDEETISDYAEEAMQWANGAGIISGRSETLLVPKGTTKRCEAAKILMQFCDLFHVLSAAPQQ